MRMERAVSALRAELADNTTSHGEKN
jgi:hypothetical protein